MKTKEKLYRFHNCIKGPCWERVHEPVRRMASSHVNSGVWATVNNAIPVSPFGIGIRAAITAEVRIQGRGG